MLRQHSQSNLKVAHVESAFCRQRGMLRESQLARTRYRAKAAAKTLNDWHTTGHMAVLLCRAVLRPFLKVPYGSSSAIPKIHSSPGPCFCLPF